MLQTSKTQIRVPFVCRQSQPIIPNIKPVIYKLSQYSSSAGSYTIIYIYGNNFTLYGNPGSSLVNFGNFMNLPISFYSSQEISFSVPTNAKPGNYTITVINTQNIAQLISNSAIYTIN